MAFMKTVQKYDVYLYPNPSKPGARIQLHCDDHTLSLSFQKSADPLPANTFNAKSKVGYAHLPFDLYPSYIDLLRYEKPIFATFRPEDAPPTFIVFCGKEPTGEGEE
jgi:hypothetical protein